MKKKLLSLLIAILLVNFLESRSPRGVIVVATGWGGGVGKIVDYLAERIEVNVRSQGGSAKGHRVVKSKDNNFNFLLLPSGIIRKNTQCYLTAGMEIDLETLFHEIDNLIEKGHKVDGRLWISARAHLVMPYHKKLDDLMLKQYHSIVDVGSRKGSGMAAADKRLRIGIRIADLLDPERFKKVLKEDLKCANAMLVNIFNEKPFSFEEILREYTTYAKRLKPLIKDDIELELNKMLIQGKAVIFEGAQGTFYDVSMGTYPYVSSSSTIASGILTGAGVGPNKIGHVLGVVQSYTTLIGAGPLPAEIKDKDLLNKIKTAHKSYCAEIPNERHGWIDLVMIRQAILLNGIDSLVLSKIDELDTLDEIKICYDYVIDGKNYDYIPANIKDALKIEPRYITLPGWSKTPINKDAKKLSQLPEEARAFVKKIETLCGVPISYISIGPRRDHMIMVNDLLPL